MSDLREELENNFASVETQSEVKTGADVEEQSINQETAVNDEWLDAPKSYKQEYHESFKALPQDFRKYLIEREKQTERGFSDLGNKLNNYKWADDVYSSRKERLEANGIKSSKEYIDILCQIEDNLTLDPAKTIQSLANAYGINIDGTQANSDNYLQSQIANIQQQLAEQSKYIQAQQKSAGDKAVNDFINAKDENGNLLHPYFEDVKPIMIDLLQKQACTNLDDAYKMATRFDDNIYNKILAEKQQVDLNNKIVEAEKSKQAGFSPKGKQPAIEKELTLREELERQFENL